MLQASHRREDEELQQDNQVWTRVSARVSQQANNKWTLDHLH